MIEEVERYINILNSSKNTNKINYLLVYYYLFKVFKWFLFGLFISMILFFCFLGV